jgi:hypothetical protein
MKATSINYWLIAAALMGGVSLGISSCSDDDKDEPNGGELTEEQYEQELLGWSLITQLTDERVAPDGWEEKTFTPTIGTAKEGDPYTRVVATNDVETAASRFSALIGQPSVINESTVGYNFSIEGIGSLSYQRGSENDDYLAQVTLDIKQVPYLKKILYQTPEQMGNNGYFVGSAYYRFGDVVSKTNSDGYPEYWICVRPAIGQEGKEESHWVTVSPLPSKNIYSYAKDGKTWYLPTGLGTNTEHMQSFVDMLYAMLQTDSWTSGISGKKNYFGDLRTAKSYQYHEQYFWQRVDQAWTTHGLYERIFAPYSLTRRDLARSFYNGGNGISLLYEGYHWKWGWEPKLVQATYTRKNNQMHTVEWTKPQKNVQNLSIDFRDLAACNGDFFDKDKQTRFIIRHATGSELAGKNYHVKTALGNGCEEVYVYNRYFYYDDNPNGLYDLNKDPEDLSPWLGYYQLGDMVKDSNNHVWICIQPAGATNDWTVVPGYKPTNKAWFVCFDPDYFKLSDGLGMSYNSYVSNVITSDQVPVVGFVMGRIAYSAVWSYIKAGNPQKNSYLAALEDIRKYAGVDFSKMFTLRDSIYISPVGTAIEEITSCTTFAVSDGCNNSRGQRLVRFIKDAAYAQQDGLRDWVYRVDSHYKNTIDSNNPHGYTEEEMFIGDLFKQNWIDEYAREEWTYTQYWGKENGNRDHPRTTTFGAASIKDFFWFPFVQDFQGDSRSMYNEPIIFCSLKSLTDTGSEPETFAFDDGTTYTALRQVNNLFQQGNYQRSNSFESWGTAYWKNEFLYATFQTNGENQPPSILH